MKDMTLEDLTDEQLQEKSRVLIDMLRTKYPKLDLRRGTVLRDLLVDADAAIGALFSAQAAEQRDVSSLLTLLERAEAGEEVSSSDVDAILSNFNMSSVSGTKAKGYIRVLVSSGDISHTVLAGVKFKTVDDRYFTVSSDITASTSPNPLLGETKQYPTSSGSYWYLVPVEADADGAAGNLEQGTALEPTTALADFLSASAYHRFSGGSDLESLAKTVERVKPSLSMRGLTSSMAIEAQLRDRYDQGGNPIVAVSVCGYGNGAQLRDKHNLFGVAVGGRADIYIRNFTDTPVLQLPEETGVMEPGSARGEGDQATASFRISLPHSRVPGIISVRSVSDSSYASDTTSSSYLFDATYSGDASGSWHDFDVSKDPRELANTIWRDVDILVKDVAVTQEERDSGTKVFQVAVVSLPDADGIQAYVDDGLVRNVAADFVVRGPMLVEVSVDAVVRYPYSKGFDRDKAVSEVCRYVNSSGFTGRLTRSEISSILINLGATSVDLADEDEMLHGTVLDATGAEHHMSGDALDLDAVAAPKAMLTQDTAVFVLEPRNVRISLIAE